MIKAEYGPLDECFGVHVFHFRSQQRGGSGGGREAAAVIHHAEVKAEAKPKAPKLVKERKTATSRHLDILQHTHTQADAQRGDTAFSPKLFNQKCACNNSMGRPFSKKNWRDPTLSNRR